MNNLLKFIKLPFREKVLYLQAMFYLLVFRIKLVYTPPKILFKKVVEVAAVAMAPQSPCLPLSKIIRIINQASRIVPNSKCLAKEFAAFILFAKECYVADLHIGVFINENRQLEAHPWLSHQRQIVLGNVPKLGSLKEIPLKSPVVAL